jgi:hypothetical protein
MAIYRVKFYSAVQNVVNLHPEMTQTFQTVFYPSIPSIIFLLQCEITPSMASNLPVCVEKAAEVKPAQSKRHGLLPTVQNNTRFTLIAI